MSDLLLEIEDAAVDDAVSVASLLRKTLLLASALSSEELRQWVDRELDGYRDVERVPDYRRLSTRALGTFRGPFGSGINNAAIPPACLPEELRKYAHVCVLRDGIANYEGLLEGRGDEPGSGNFQSPWPPDLVMLLQDHTIYSGMSLVEAWLEIPRNAILELVSTVRTRLLRFALALRASAPDLAVHRQSRPDIAQEAVHQSYVVHIQGDQPSVALGSRDFVQAPSVVQGDITSLMDALRRLGVADSELQELSTIVSSEKSDVGLGPRAAAWVGRVTSKLVGSAVDSGAASAGAEVARVVLRYFGMAG